ncbi:MAG: TetR/AcrR family transcriptional regulator [Proteobacteria bacterium]|nr:TetR/AcrR family transcriptional regulator [Pseudomonadota bacterium]
MTGKKQAKQGSYQKGKDKRQDVLEVAAELLIESGYHNFSMRKVADAAGIRLGNLQYYFPSKAKLVKAMLDHALSSYLDAFVEIRRQGTPEEQFLAVIDKVVNDLSKKRTTVFFPEVWSLSNHEKGVTQAMDEMYENYRKVLADIIGEVNPALSALQARRLALFISASIEGHTIFIGYRKPWTKETANIIHIAKQSFLWLIMQGDIPE